MQLIREQDRHEDFNTAYCTYGTRLQKFLANFTCDGPVIAKILDEALSEWLETPPHPHSTTFVHLQQIARKLALVYTHGSLASEKVAEYREEYYRFPKDITSEDRAIFYAEYFHGLDVITISKVFKKPSEQVIEARKKIFLHIRNRFSEQPAREKVGLIKKFIKGLLELLHFKKSAHVK
jgi:DNA-directed RNA polymerase specialized sigma24 family protein